MILLANSDSHFSLQKPISIIGDAGPKAQDAEDFLSSAIQCLESCVLCPNKSDYSHYLVWIAKPFNTNVLQHSHQKIMITFITYTIANDYYICYLAIETQNLGSLLTQGRKLKTEN